MSGRYCLCSDPDYCLRNTPEDYRARAIEYRREHGAPLPKGASEMSKTMTPEELAAERAGQAMAVADAVGRMARAKADRDAAMAAMRSAGATLSEIGKAAGMTPRGVQQALGGKGF